MKVTLVQGSNPEVAAAKIALASRTLTPIGRVEMGVDQAAEFHWRWTVGEKHFTIADHAVVQFEVEGVTRLAGVFLEDARLAGYMETSTRYFEFGPEALFVPDGLGWDLTGEYREAGLGLFGAYRKFLPKVQDWVLSRNPRRADESETVWKSRLRYRWVDICRFLLPRGTLVKVDVTMNARELAHTLGKMLVNPLVEVQRLAITILGEVVKVCPTFVRLVEPPEYRVQLQRLLRSVAVELGLEIEVPDGPYVDLVKPDSDSGIQFLTLCLYPVSKLPYRNLRHQVGDLPERTREGLLREITSLLTPTRTIRALELTDSSVFDVCVDWGAYYDLKRHRMCTIIPQENGIDLGYLIPQPIVEIGGLKQYEEALRAVERVHGSIAEAISSEVAEYVATNAHLKRFLMGMNLRELLYVIWRRSGKGGHFSYRWVAARMHELASEVWPALISISQLRRPPSEELAKEYFAFGRY